MKTAVIYARYSSDNQTEQSIEGQLRVCQQYAKSNDILIVGTYVDRAMTGTNDARPDFQRMIKDSNKHQWDYVIVYKLDRFSRNKYEATIHKHTLKENGIKLLSAMENIPDTPEGIILESMLEGMNQYFSAELSQKVKRGLKESYIKGNFTGGYQIYGYDVVDKKTVINPTEAEIVKEIFTKFASGITGKSISDNLISRGIRNKHGQYFTDKRIYKTLSNPKYIGKIQHGDTVYTNIYPAIIDESTWQAVQLIRNSYKQKPGSKKPKFNYILTGKLICGHCKKFIVGESGSNKIGERYRYYVCLSRKRYRKPCDFRSIRKDWLEDLVIQTTLKLLRDNATQHNLVNAIYSKHQIENKETFLIKSLENRRDEALKSSNNLIRAIEQGIITEQTKTRLKELELQISQLEFDIEEAKHRNYSYLTPNQIKAYFDKIISKEISADIIAENIVKYLIREVIVYNDKIIITYNFTDTNIYKRTTTDDIKEIEDAIKQTEKSAFSQNLCSYKDSSTTVEMTKLW